MNELRNSVLLVGLIIARVANAKGSENAAANARSEARGIGQEGESDLISPDLAARSDPMVAPDDRASRFVYAEHFQPEGVLLSFVSLQVGIFYLSLLPIAFGEIDQARALGADHVHAQAQRLRLILSVHAPTTRSLLIAHFYFRYVTWLNRAGHTVRRTVDASGTTGRECWT